MKTPDSGHEGHNHQHPDRRAYWMLALNLALSLVPMYFAMFTMIDGWGDFRNNVNMLYMALTMLAPMGIIMLATMGGMYANRTLNLVLYAGLAVLLGVSLFATRAQALVDDKQFIASMIPHHSGAILMCREARLSDSELVKLCENIARGQRAEIGQMEAIQARLGANR